MISCLVIILILKIIFMILKSLLSMIKFRTNKFQRNGKTYTPKMKMNPHLILLPQKAPLNTTIGRRFESRHKLHIIKTVSDSIKTETVLFFVHLISIFHHAYAFSKKFSLRYNLIFRFIYNSVADPQFCILHCAFCIEVVVEQSSTLLLELLFHSHFF